MELRTYWSIIWRRIWVIALVVIIVGLYAGYQYYHLRKTPGALKAYQSVVAIQIGLQANPKAADPNSADYIATSETLADVYTTGPVLALPEFDTQVVQQIRSDMSTITARYGPNADLGDWQNAGAIGASLSATRAHSLVSVAVTWNTEAGAWAIAQAVGEVSAANISTYVDYVIHANATTTTTSGNIQPVVAAKVVSAATTPAVIAGSSANRPTLLLVLVLVSLIIGIALAFLIEYLDDRIRTPDTVAQLLQLPIYGEVPRAPTLGQKSPRSSSRT